MDTLTDLENAIGAVQDASTRANLWLHAGAQQTHAGNYANAVTMLIKARDIVAGFDADMPRDYMVSQLAYEFARARDTTRAQNALAYIADTQIEDETRGRIAVQASVYNVSVALAVVATIEDALTRDNALANVAYERAKQGALLQALDIVENMSDTALIPSAQHQIIRLASEVIT